MGIGGDIVQLAKRLPAEDVERLAIETENGDLSDEQRGQIERDARGLQSERVRRADAKRSPADIFNLVGAADIFAPLEPPDDLVEGILRRGSLLLIGGFGGGAKTWTAIDLVLAVTSGTPWLGRFPTAPGFGAFLDWENGSYELRRRAKLAAAARELDGAALGLHFCSFPGVYIEEPRFEAAIRDLATHRSIIVIDTLKAASTSEENDSSIRRGLDVLRAAGERTGCSFAVLVHSKKTSGNPMQVDDREVFRGSSAIYDAADSALAMFLDREEKCFLVRHCKSRHGRDVDPFRVRLKDVNGGVLVVAEDMPVDESVQSNEEKFTATVEAVRRALRGDPGLGTVALRAKVGGNAKMVDGALEWLIGREEVVDLGPGATQKGKPHLYRIRGDQ